MEFRTMHRRLPQVTELGVLADKALVLFLGLTMGLPREGFIGLFYLKCKHVDMKDNDRGL
jgi:hypothetical protein